ncbi:DUF3025 domain-containing protein [Hydrogenophaga sp. NFH-34]|uniref:DUF3025 domain-containing protein n=1 Tax=Hydrogenophaga sp. NFH-34 TaxID=2744446 RepID=UPI001F1C76B6|nr:DUF3025 domain-containing protein [Hydrogenophaga sp. NFH-34]
MCAATGAKQARPSPDWSQPWNAAFATAGAAVCAACARGVPLPQALTQQVGAAGPRFVPQGELPEGMAYEQFIFETGAVPTREGLHDFFNGLVWQRFPATKRLLNRLQAAQIAQAGVGQVRGPVRDAITLFDENAVLLQAPDEIWDALIAREWTRLFVDLRPLWAQTRLVAFGHALLEKLVLPYKSITGHVYRAPVPTELGDDLAAWDHWLAARLTATELATKPFTPLPVLGVPGWWPANQQPAFYNDDTVFRPPRIATAHLT